MDNILEKILLHIISRSPETKADFNHFRREVCSKMKIKIPSNRQLLSAYQILIKKKRIKPIQGLVQLFRKADIRTLSGIAVVTSLAKPFPCPGKCIYCPNEANMPKSYLASEPAAARALKLQFDPFLQMKRRIEMLEQSGHPTDKIEFIIKGGTWNAYPLAYQYWFILQSFNACNKKMQTGITQRSSLKKLQTALSKAQQENETAKHRIIGLTIETRPDAINPGTIMHMRNQGCTRVELGLQIPDDKILKLVQRGHTVQQFKDAILLLRNAGFKVDLHFMPDLPGSTAKHDVKMYQKLFADPGFKPDMIKIYPCTVIKSSVLYKWFKQKKYKPYPSEQLFNALILMKTLTPRYCRISRLIRDIPASEIQAGNAITNLREELKKVMNEQEIQCKCLRCREIGHQQLLMNSKPKLFIDKYKTKGGTEYFISYEDSKRQAVFAFLRLRLPEKREQSLIQQMPELKDCAFVRELHTYGQLVSVGKKDVKASQHKGLGKKLIAQAEKIAKQHHFYKLAVISGIGVRPYYRQLGYRKTKTYMIKRLNQRQP